MDFALKHMKALMVHYCLLAYPNHNKPFHIYTNASIYQMGAYIVQDDKPVAFWLHKLDDAQLKYTVVTRNSLPLSWFWSQQKKVGIWFYTAFFVHIPLIYQISTYTSLYTRIFNFSHICDFHIPFVYQNSYTSSTYQIFLTYTRLTLRFFYHLFWFLMWLEVFLLIP